MSIIRYTHIEYGNGIPASKSKIKFSETPFVRLTNGQYTDNIRITLSNGFFVCGHEHAYPNYSINQRSNGTYFHWCANGKGTYNGMPFKKNDVFVVHRDTQKTMVADENEPWELYWCVWKGEISDTAAAKLNNYEDNMIYRLENDINLTEFFNFLIYQPHRERRIQKTVNGFSDILFSDCHIIQKSPHGPIKDGRAKTVIEIQKYINANYLDISVEKVADHFHYNRKYITRVFHEYTGMTMCDCIREAKLHAAELYLLTAGGSVEEVAFKAGYSNYSSFIKAFKKKNGITPTEFKELYGEN